MLSVIIRGVEYDLEAIASLVAHDGWGLAPFHRLSERGPQQHGDTDVGYYLDPRIGNLVFQLKTSTLDDMYETPRQTLLGLFSPANSLTLKFAMPYGDRSIDCKTVDVQMPWEQKEWAAQKVSIALKAPDPTFYDPTALYKIFQIGAGSDTWEVPFEVPWTVGASTINTEGRIVYAGNAPCYPVIRITGPLEDALIFHVELGLTLSFDGVTIANGDYYEIDLRYGRKSILNASGTNKIADLTSASDLAEFRIAPDPDAGGGVNSFIVTGKSATTVTKVTITYYNRYLGI